MVAQHANGAGSGTSPRTAYLGPEASFSHQAAVEALPNTQPVPLPSFKAILSAIQQSEENTRESYNYAVLPVENSTNGSVVQALDLLAQCRLDPDTSNFPDVEVIDEYYLEVHHCLFVSRIWAEQRLTKEELDSLDSDQNDTPDRKRLEQLLPRLNIRTLYTHPQVWGQCNDFLSSLLPPGHVDRVDMSSTSAAAAYIATHPSNVQDEDQIDSGGIAAISSSLAGAKHGRALICLAQNIEDDPGTNTTRFLILRNRLLNPPDPPLSHLSNKKSQVKSLFTFTIEHHVPGSLAETLAVFAKHGFNLSAIQSRPKPKPKPKPKINVKTTNEATNGASEQNKQLSNWKYVFFVECLHIPTDIASTREEEKLESLCEELRTVTEQLSLLGSWLVV